jgi:tRNA(fMet)-specific endonuclease VapC
MQFILDTDHVSLILRGDSRIQSVIKTKQNVSTSIITAQELFNGWVVRINNAKPSDNFVVLYADFCDSINYLKKTEILSFNEFADVRFRQLLQEHPCFEKGPSSKGYANCCDRPLTKCHSGHLQPSGF